MPYEHLVDTTNRITTVRMFGTVTGPEVVAALEGVYQHPDWKSGFALVGDLTGVMAVMLDKQDFHSFVAIHRKHELDAAPRVEVIIVRRDLDNAMAHVYKMFLRSLQHPVHICWSLAEANPILFPAQP